MPDYTTEGIRNVALVGHGGGGKTTLIEALLHRAGRIGAQGSLERGDTVSDFDPQEKKHKHSLFNAVVSCDHNGRHINLIDTPGYPDLMGQALSVLPAVETVAVVINAAAGIELMTRRMMERAVERNLCRMIIINRIDADNVDLPGLLEQIQETFGPECLPVNLPAKNRTAVVDVFRKAEGDSDFSSVEEAHTAIIDQVVEVDEALMASYLEQGTVNPDQLHDPFEKALRDGHLVPVLFVSGQTGVGVPELLDFLATMAPNPFEGNPRPFQRTVDDHEEDYHAVPDADKHVIAHVFKVGVDPFVGRLGVFRIHQGTIRTGMPMYAGHARRAFRVTHLFKLHGKEHFEVDSGVPGDICALAKLEELEYDVVLHDDPSDASIHLKPMDFPEPMYGLAIESKTRGDEQKVAKALSASTAEDPCLKVERNSTTHETVIRGLGELHLRMVLERMNDRYHVEVDTHPPKIAYRETILGSSEGHHRHKKQTGGAGQFGEVFLRVSPLERGAGFEFSNDIFGGKIPQQYLPAVEKGIRQALAEGVLAGYPLQDVKVSVYDGKHHPVDSKEVAFVAAGRRAFVDGVLKANPVLLEPMVTVDVTVPSDYMGDITGDLSGKRGRIIGTDALAGGMVTVKAQAPLSELGMYQSQLKAMTGGQGAFSMAFSHYEPTPPHVQQQIVSQYKPRHEED